MKAGQLILLLVLSVWLAAAAGCTSLERVKPWDRGELASDLMRTDLNPMEERDMEKVYFSREGSAGGFGSGGGGCGCN